MTSLSIRTVRIRLDTPEGALIREHYGLDKSVTEIVRQYAIGEFERAEEDGERPVMITTDDIDRMGEVVHPAGVDLENYRKNPVILWAHNYNLPPIGSAKWVQRQEHGIVAKPRWANHQFAQDIKELYAQGHMKAWSIGFIPKEWEDGNGTKKAPSRIYTKTELLEFSAVPVPANPAALSLALAKGLVVNKALLKELGIDGEPMADLASVLQQERDAQDGAKMQTLIFDKGVFKNSGEVEAWASDHDFRDDTVDEAADGYRLRQRDPDDFDPDSFRTIPLTEGVKAVIGKLRKAIGEMPIERLKAVPEKEAQRILAKLETIEQRISSIERAILAPTGSPPPAKIRIHVSPNASSGDAPQVVIRVGNRLLPLEQLRTELQKDMREAVAAGIRYYTGRMS